MCSKSLTFSGSQAEAALSAKREAFDSDVAAFAGTKQEYDTATKDLAKAEELLQTLITGLSANSNEEGEAAGGYMGQLAEAKAMMAAAATEAEQAKMKIGLLEKELKDKEPRAKKASKEGEGLTKEYDSAKKKLETLRASMGKMDWDENREKELSNRKAELDERIAGLVEVRVSVGAMDLILTGCSVETRLPEIKTRRSRLFLFRSLPKL